MKKSIAPKIEGTAADWISGMFPSLNAGSTFLLEAMPGLYRKSLSEMAFSEEELHVILDVLQDHRKTMCRGSADMAGRTLPLKIADTENETLLNRINDLPRFSIVCLEIWAASFWQQEGNKTKEEWVEAF
jgi:hypothetical protein